AAVPAKATANTTQPVGTRETQTRIRAERKPLRSATATPMITATMVAIGGNAAKLSIIVDTAIARPSPLSRLRTTTVSPSLGETTEAPRAASTALVPARIAARIQNSQKGCGSALPTRSITAMARMIRGSGTSGAAVGPPDSGGTGRDMVVSCGRAVVRRGRRRAAGTR